MKKFLSVVIGGLALALGATLANATAIIDTGGTDFEGFADITGFRPDVNGVYDNSFNVNLSLLSGTLNFTDVPTQDGHIKAFGSIIFDSNANTPADIDPNGSFPGVLKTTFNGQTVFTGTFGATWPVSSTTFGAGSGQTLAVNDVATLTYAGISDLFNSILPPGGLGPVANNPLTLTVTSASDNSLGLRVDETSCNTAGQFVCLEKVLTTLDSPPIGSPNTLDSITGAFRINGSLVVPEPATWTLLGIGLAGLGFIRRKKAA